VANSYIGKKLTRHEDLAGWVDEIKNRERLRNRQVWLDMINVLAAFHNRSDLKIGTDYRQLERMTPAQKAELEEIAVNWVQPHVRTLAAHLLKARPAIECVPSTTDEVDIQAARAGDRMIKGEWQHQNMDTRRMEAMMWVASAGNAFWHIYFDRDDGPWIDTPQGPVFSGQVKTETISPFKIVVEPNRDSIENCRWAIISQRLPKDQVEAQYADSYRDLHKEEIRLGGDKNSGQTGNGPSGKQVIDAFMAVVGLDRTGALDDDDFVDIDLLYHLPTKDYPNGLYAVTSGGRALYIGAYPYAFLGQLPICHFREILAPWRFLGETGSINVLRAQEHYVWLRKMERRALQNFAHGKWMIPKGCRVRRDHLTNPLEPYVAYTSRGGEKPDFVPGQNPPQGIIQAQNTARDDGNRASGINEASQGVAPTGITAGRALLALQEMDATRMGLTVQLSETEYSRWGTIELQLVRKFYKEPRKYALTGEALQGSIQFFDAAELRDTTDVKCVPGSAMPSNKAAKQESVMALYTAGILGVPQDPETVARARKMLEFGQTEDIHDEDALDEQAAELENQALVGISTQIPPGTDPQMMAGQVPVGLWDNHIVHLRTHRRRWQSLIVRGDAMGAAMVETHMMQHAQIMNPQPQPQEQPAPPGPEPIPADAVPQDQLLANSEPQLQEGIGTVQNPTDLQLTPADMPRGER